MGARGAGPGAFEALAALRPTGSQLRIRARQLAAVFAAARRAGVLGRPLPPPAEEARPKGVRHSLTRDACAISHHYDVGNDFYRIVLGPSMTYSCARFTDPAMTLTDAQASKHDLVCRKPGLDERPAARLLDVGCGWGMDGHPRRRPRRHPRRGRHHQPPAS